jgi:hypothetical protein
LADGSELRSFDDEVDRFTVDKVMSFCDELLDERVDFVIIVCFDACRVTVAVCGLVGCKDDDFCFDIDAEAVCDVDFPIDEGIAFDVFRVSCFVDSDADKVVDTELGEIDGNFVADVANLVVDPVDLIAVDFDIVVIKVESLLVGCVVIFFVDDIVE